MTLDTKTNATARLVPTLAKFVVKERLQGMAITQLGGQPFICGGETPTAPFQTQSCDLYSATTGWTVAGNLPYTVAFAAMTSLNGVPYIFGGMTSQNADVTNRVLKYNSVAKTWTDVAPMPVPLVYHSAVNVSSDVAMVCGGQTVWDPNQPRSAKCYLYISTINLWTEMGTQQFATPRTVSQMAIFDSWADAGNEDLKLK